jgi:hypothetical protein
MFETYRMLGREREIELLQEADRLRPLVERRGGPSLSTTLFVIGIVVVAALLVLTGTTSVTT